MRKLTAVLAAAIMVVALGSLVFAAEMQKGTIKSVDAKTGTVVFCPEGTNTDVTLKADDSVDVKSVKVGEKVEVTVDKNVLKGVKYIYSGATHGVAPLIFLPRGRVTAAPSTIKIRFIPINRSQISRNNCKIS
jgi:hypothetical protein